MTITKKKKCLIRWPEDGFILVNSDIWSYNDLYDLLLVNKTLTIQLPSFILIDFDTVLYNILEELKVNTYSLHFSIKAHSNINNNLTFYLVDCDIEHLSPAKLSEYTSRLHYFYSNYKNHGYMNIYETILKTDVDLCNFIPLIRHSLYIKSKEINFNDYKNNIIEVEARVLLTIKI